jgi:hypothetical protein
MGPDPGLDTENKPDPRKYLQKFRYRTQNKKKVQKTIISEKTKRSVLVFKAETNYIAVLRSRSRSTGKFLLEPELKFFWSGSGYVNSDKKLHKALNFSD